MKHLKMLSLMNKKTIYSSALFYLTEIKHKLDVRNWTPLNVNEEIVVISSPEVSYCHPAIELVQKHMSKRGWTCKLTHFYITHSNRYSYTFTFKPPIINDTRTSN